MQEILLKQLYEYIRKNNPDLLFSLQVEGRVTVHLQQQLANVSGLVEELQGMNTPAYAIEELCMNALTQPLVPSRYNYLCGVLSEEFEANYYRMLDEGTLTTEVINMIEACRPLFDEYGFSKETEDNQHLRYSVIGTVDEYLNQ